MARALDFGFPLSGGLHARPAAALQDAVAAFSCAVTFANLRNGARADARSTLALVASDTRIGDPCRLIVEGLDEEPAAAVLARFIVTELPACAAPVPDVRPASGCVPRALRGERVVPGIPVSAGIARGTVVALDRSVEVEDAQRPQGGVQEELDALAVAFERAGEELRRRPAGLGEVARGIVAAQLGMLSDSGLRARVEEAIRAGSSAAAAVRAAADQFAAMLEATGSALLAARALDVREVAAALLVGLGGRRSEVVLDREAVGAAEGLGPAALLALDRRRLRGLVLGRSGATSHAAIVARSRGVPCVGGVSGLPAGGEAIVDGGRGLVVLDPGPAAVRFYEAERRRRDERAARVDVLCDRPGATADGRRIEIAANAASVEDVQAAIAAGAEGIGLYRTELLFAGRSAPPSEDEQAEAYAAALHAARGRVVIVRLLDAGGDKPLPFLRSGPEANPFLGVRGVRLYAANEALIATQARALLRASAHGRLRILVPMVSTLGEARWVRALVQREQEALRARGVDLDADVEIGAMVEVPAAALAVDRLATVADFFSIGSNDLLQYTFAADRGNPAVAPLSDPLHPAFLRLLARAVRDARAHGRRIGLCGELAGDDRLMPLLVGLGLDEISVAAPLVGPVKAALGGCESAACHALLEQAIDAEGPEQVRELLARRARAARPLIEPDLVCLASDAADKTEAIRELIGRLELTGRVDDADAVEAAVWCREEAHPTAVGLGVAVPHCASPAVRHASLAVARYASPLEWGGGEPVSAAMLIAVPERAEQQHLRLIAALSRRLVDDEFRRALAAASERGSVVALVTRATGEGDR